MSKQDESTLIKIFGVLCIIGFILLASLLVTGCDETGDRNEACFVATSNQCSLWGVLFNEDKQDFENDTVVCLESFVDINAKYNYEHHICIDIEENQLVYGYYLIEMFPTLSTEDYFPIRVDYIGEIQVAMNNTCFHRNNMPDWAIIPNYDGFYCDMERNEIRSCSDIPWEDHGQPCSDCEYVKIEQINDKGDCSFKVVCHDYE